MKRYVLSYCLTVAVLVIPISLSCAQDQPDENQGILLAIQAASDSQKLVLYDSLVRFYTLSDSAVLLGHLDTARNLALQMGASDAYWQFVLHKGEVYVKFQNMAEALSTFNEVIASPSAYHSRRALLDKGKALMKSNEHGRALSVLSSALTQFKSHEEEDLTGETLQMIGKCYSIQSKINESNEYLAEALGLFNRIGNQHGIAAVLILLAHNQRTLKQYNEAMLIYQQALSAYKLLEDSSNITSTYQFIAITQQEMGYFDRSLIYLDSGLTILQHTNSPYLYARALALNAETFFKKGFTQEAKTYFLKSHTIGVQTKRNEMYAFCALRLGQIYIDLQAPDSALYFYNEALAICEELNNQKYKRELMAIIASSLIEQGETNRALDFLYLALSQAEKASDTLNIATIYGQFAFAEQSQNNLDAALTYYHKALKLYSSIGRANEAGRMMAQIGAIAITMTDYDSAAYYLSAARDTFISTGDSCKLGECDQNLGQLMILEGNPDSALTLLYNAEAIELRCGRTPVLAAIYGSIGDILLQKGQKEKGITTLEKGLNHSLSIKNLNGIKTLAARLHPLYIEQGRAEDAYGTLLLYTQNSDSLFNEQNTRALAQKEATFAYEKEKEKEAARLALREQEQKQLLARQQWWTITGITGFLVMVLIAGILYRNYQLKQKANTLLTERNEEIAQQKEQLEALDQTKSRFFSNISHELRTPLTLISSPLLSILDKEADQVPPAIREHLQLIQRNTKQLQGLIEDILDLTKLENDKIEVHQSTVSPSAFAGRLIGNFDSLATHLGIELQQEVPAALDGKQLQIDENKVERIANNLLSNALKHTPGGGTVTLRLSHTENTLQLSVSDTGAGIPTTDLPYLFDRYFQSKQPGAPYQGGSGIGLALSRELARAMEGNLQVNSTEGEGSCFTLNIPCKAIPAATEQVDTAPVQEEEESIPMEILQPASQTGERKEHVLIVEDHPDMQRYVESLLLSRYHVHKASNGHEALDVLSRQSIDLVISDVMMPGMDGFTLLDKLRQDPVHATLPVIMLTALSEESFKLKALTIGVDDYLPKPFSPQELLARTHNLLQNHAARKEALAGQPALVAIEEDIPEEVGDPMDTIIKGQAWIRELVEVLRSNLETDHFLLSELHETYSMSERKFQRKVKELTGLTPKQLQQEVVLQEARSLLEGGAYSALNAVALSVGMENVTRFSRLYEARFGKDPREYFG